MNAIISQTSIIILNKHWRRVLMSFCESKHWDFDIACHFKKELYIFVRTVHPPYHLSFERQSPHFCQNGLPPYFSIRNVANSSTDPLIGVKSKFCKDFIGNFEPSADKMSLLMRLMTSTPPKCNPHEASSLLSSQTLNRCQTRNHEN